MSTGALIAPFAFLGPAYDPVLTEIYTSGVAESLVKNPSVVNVLFSSGLFGDDRLRDLVGRYVTPDLLTAIAAEHAKGRRLLVVTTNLDAKRAMIWNMGVIAASGAPNAVALFRDVLTASASIPAVFPPQFLDVQVGDRIFQELHVDGSVVTPVFTVPQAFMVGDGRTGVAPRKSDIYVLMNGRVEPEFELVTNNTLSIVEQAVATGSQARSRASLARPMPSRGLTVSVSTSRTSTRAPHAPRPLAASTRPTCAASIKLATTRPGPDLHGVGTFPSPHWRPKSSHRRTDPLPSGRPSSARVDSHGPASNECMPLAWLPVARTGERPGAGRRPSRGQAMGIRPRGQGPNRRECRRHPSEQATPRGRRPQDRDRCGWSATGRFRRGAFRLADDRRARHRRGEVRSPLCRPTDALLTPEGTVDLRFRST